jgi:putative tryptophan/tyrosine transport system substrate-binding protein
MRRRDFIAAFASSAAAAWPLTASAQQTERMRRIGVLMAIAGDDLGQSRLAAFLDGLKQLG